MSLRSCLVILIAALIPGCASYKPTSAPVASAPVVASASASAPDSLVTVTAQLYRDPSGKEALFDADLDEDGLYAVRVTVDNRSAQKVVVNRSDMSLRRSGGGEIGTISGASAAQRVDEEGSVVGMYLLFGIVGALGQAASEDSAKQSRISDYGNKEFKDTILAPGNRAAGYVFFAPAEGTPPFTAADLIVRLSDPVTGDVKVAAVPLKGFTGAASGSTASVSVAPPDTALASVQAAGGPSGIMAVSAAAVPADAYLHAPSGLAVARAAGTFWRTRISEPVVGGHSMLIADYESDTPAGPALASVRVMRPDAQETGKPARQVCDDQMQAAADAVISGRNGTRIAERDVALLRNGLPVPGRMMGFRYDVAGAATEEYFYLFCDVGGGWALTHRVSSPQEQLAPAALDAFVQQAAVAPGQAGVQAINAPLTQAPAGGQVFNVTPQTGTPIQGTPIQDTPAASVEDYSGFEKGCRPSFNWLGDHYCATGPGSRLEGN